MLSVKLIGALMIVGSSTWVGIHSARALKRSDRRLKALRASLTLMENELRYTNIRFRPLCERLAEAAEGEVAAFFRDLAEQAAEESFRPAGAMKLAAERTRLSLPPAAQFALEQLIDGFGRYDLEGQLRQIALAESAVERQLEHDRLDLESRCRTYELLGFCTGAALLILVI